MWANITLDVVDELYSNLTLLSPAQEILRFAQNDMRRAHGDMPQYILERRHTPSLDLDKQGIHSDIISEIQWPSFQAQNQCPTILRFACFANEGGAASTRNYS
jgi:hypothetical protein